MQLWREAAQSRDDGTVEIHPVQRCMHCATAIEGNEQVAADCEDGEVPGSVPAHRQPWWAKLSGCTMSQKTIF